MVGLSSQLLTVAAILAAVQDHPRGYAIPTTPLYSHMAARVRTLSTYTSPIQ